MPEIWICLFILHNPEAFKDSWGSKFARVLIVARLYMQGLQSSEYD